MDEKLVLRKNPDVVTRQIEDETILVPIFKTSVDMNCIYTFNKIASYVWDLIDGKRTLKDIKEIVLKKFDTTPKEVDKEMSKFLKELKQIKAIA
jgi:methyltransferase-like protein